MCYACSAYSKQLTSGLDLKLSSRVALLTRNIVIEGVAYDSMDNQSFGARVLVGRGVEDGVSLSGMSGCLSGCLSLCLSVWLAGCLSLWLAGCLSLSERL